MAMPAGQKVFIYLVGVLLGILILRIIPREETSSEPHPWHAQTAPEGTYPLSIKDDWGREITLTRQPRWIVSLAPSITEMLFAMGMGDHLIAVTQWDDYPEKVKLLRDSGGNLGDMAAPNLEMIKTLRPQLVFATEKTAKEVLESLSNPPATVAISLQHDTVAEIYEDIGSIGHILGVPGKALELTRKLEAKEKLLTDRFSSIASSRRQGVLVLFSLEKDGSGGWTAGRETWLNDVIEAAQGVNIAAERLEGYGWLTVEEIKRMQPEAIFVVRAHGAEGSMTGMGWEAQLAEDPLWRQVDAVQKGNVFEVDSGPFSVPGPRFVEAIEIVGKALWE